MNSRKKWNSSHIYIALEWIPFNNESHLKLKQVVIDHWVVVFVYEQPVLLQASKLHELV